MAGIEVSSRHAAAVAAAGRPRRVARAVPGPGAPRPCRSIVANGTSSRSTRDRRVIPRGAVAIDGRDIVAVDTAEAIAARFRGRDTIDAAGAVVMPGLINTHTHAPMVLFRGLADDLALMDWLQKYIFPAEAKTVSPEFVRAGTRLAALEMIESGTTTYADMYYFEDEIARVDEGGGPARRPRRDDHPVSRRRRENAGREPGAHRSGSRRSSPATS